MLGGSAANATYPDPVDHCESASGIRRASSGAAMTITCRSSPGIAERHRTAIDGGVPTLTALGDCRPTEACSEMPTRTVDRFRQQARIQFHERETGDRVYELIPPDPTETGRGLAALPEPSHTTSSSTSRASLGTRRRPRVPARRGRRRWTVQPPTCPSGATIGRARRPRSRRSSTSSSTVWTPVPRCTSTTTAGTSPARSSA